MPLGFHPHPGGILDNSPMFQRWVPQFEAVEVPKGRMKRCDMTPDPPQILPQYWRISDE
jgi:hypothetical protein